MILSLKINWDSIMVTFSSVRQCVCIILVEKDQELKEMIIWEGSYLRICLTFPVLDLVMPFGII